MVVIIHLENLWWITKSEGEKKSHDVQIEKNKKNSSESASTESRSGISIVACCDAFLDHRPFLLSELFTIFF